MTQATLHLKGFGRTRAISYGDVSPGTKIAYNWGHVYTVVKTEPAGKTSVRVTVQNNKGENFTSTHRRSTLIGLA